ncbi:GxxExxY protein [soil metagenome]
MALLHSSITDRIIKVYYDVYSELGCGFLESLYEKAMEMALIEAGLKVCRQKDVHVFFRGRILSEFRVDMVVEEAVILEFKSCKALEDWHASQLINYLRSTKFEVGMLFNFGPSPEFRRLAFSNSRKRFPEGQNPE